MTDLSRHLRTMKRPRILVQAARHGAGAYERRRDLRRLTRVAVAPTPALALPKLIALEAQVEERRLSEDPNYSMARHVDLLTAMVAEGTKL